MCVLLVDDDLVIRVVMTGALKQTGYEVEEALDGEAGLAAFDRRPERFRALVIEGRLPGIFDGRDVADYVHARRPELPILVTSGDRRILKACWHRASGFAVLPKPYHARDLLRVLGPMIETPGK